MSKPDYKAMSEADLRTYAIQNPDAIEAFHAYVDKVNELNPDRTPMSAEDAIAELQRQVAQGRR